MPRYVNPFPQYINISGSPVSGGFLNFFDTGTNDPKDVYNAPSPFIEDNNIGSSVRLDSAGRVPPIFLNGGYRVVLTDKNGNELDAADPVGLDTDIVNFDAWLNTNTYNIPGIVKGSDNLYYKSMVDTNLGNDPTDAMSAFWEQINFLPVWNTVETYFQGQLVIGGDSRTYQSQTGSNSGNDPTSDDGTNWKQLLQNGDSINVSGLTISKIGPETASFDYVNSEVVRWRWLFDVDTSLNLRRYNSGGSLLNTIMSFDNLQNEIDLDADVSLEGNFEITQGDFSIVRDTEADPILLTLSSDAAENTTIQMQDAGVKRWEFGQNTVNIFALNGYSDAGVGNKAFIACDYDTGKTSFAAGNISFFTGAQGIDIDNGAGGYFNLNFTSLSANTEDVSVRIFDNTETTGDRLVSVYKGDGSSTVTCQIDAETGSIFPAFDRSGESDTGVKLGKITLSTDAPSGGEDGDLWLRY